MNISERERATLNYKRSLRYGVDSDEACYAWYRDIGKNRYLFVLVRRLRIEDAIRTTGQSRAVAKDPRLIVLKLNPSYPRYEEEHVFPINVDNIPITGLVKWTR